MMFACQGCNGVFGILAIIFAATSGVLATPTLAAAAPVVIPVNVSAWTPRPFAHVVLETPELAGCFALMPSWWTAAQPPKALGEPSSLGAVLSAQLSDVLASVASLQLNVVVAESENAALSAVASGATILLMLPAAQPLDLQEAARAVIAALERGHSTPAAPDPRCSEPLLALAEGIASAGSITLATLPTTLRPVSDWLEAADAAKPLTALAEAALDGDQPWAARRVRLQQTALRSSANATLLNAAARVVEAFGDAVRARQEPFEVLLAWRENRDKRYPTMPSALRRAIAEPLAAGMPSKSRSDDIKLIAREALERSIESGAVAATTGSAEVAAPLRLLAAAAARAQGTGTACQWVLAGPLPASLRTGCRSDEKAAAYVTARPRLQGGFEVFAATAPEESVLLRWPGWVLFPLVTPDASSLIFVDQDGIRTVSLDSSSKPRLLLSGSFRHLALSPDGKRLATARWPEGGLVVTTLAGAVSSYEVDARGGVTWVDADLLLAAGRKGATVVSLTGEARPFPSASECTTTLARQGTAVLIGIAAPCECGIAQLQLGSGEAKLVLKRLDGPLGIVALADGSVVFSDAEGISRWRPGESPTRIGSGFTPGPG
jgi:hypothetical protein